MGSHHGAAGDSPAAAGTARRKRPAATTGGTAATGTHPPAVQSVMAGRVMGSGAAAGVQPKPEPPKPSPLRLAHPRPGTAQPGQSKAASSPPRKLSETRKAIPPHTTAIQRQPAAAGYPGDDEDFLREVLRLRIVPIRVRMRDEDGGTLFMIDFPAAYQCQIHIHEAATGEINGAHIKSNAGNIRHSMNYVDAINYLEVLNQLHSQNQMEIRQDD